MDAAILLSFAGVVSVFFITPGPTNLVVVNHAIAGGIRSGMIATLGVLCANAVGITLAFAGLGAVLATSPGAFKVVTAIGAAYLVYLAWRLWSDRIKLYSQPVSPGRVTANFLDGFVVTLSNPKIMIFYVAFFPQFVTDGNDRAFQIFTLAAVYIALSFVGCSVHSICANGLRDVLREGPWARRVNKVSALLLVATAAVAVAST